MIATIDAMDNAAGWTPVEPDGVTPSIELVLADETNASYLGADQTAMALSASTVALDHAARRDLPAPLDASAWPELSLTLRADRLADGSPEHPFYLRLRLGSAAVPLADPANTWHRYLPVTSTGDWRVNRISLDDLPAAIRSGLSVIELTCVDAARGFSCLLDDLILVDDRLISDCDDALVDRLHQTFTLLAPVPALLLRLGEALTLAPRPAFGIGQYRLEWDEARSDRSVASGDFTDAGYRLRSARHAFVTHYVILALADDRADQARLLDFASQALSPRDRLQVNDYHCPSWWLPTPSFHDAPWPTVYPQIHVALVNWRTIGADVAAVATQQVTVGTDYLLASP